MNVDSRLGREVCKGLGSIGKDGTTVLKRQGMATRGGEKNDDTKGRAQARGSDAWQCNDQREREKEKECRGPWWWRRKKKERKDGNGGTNEQK